MPSRRSFLLSAGAAAAGPLFGRRLSVVPGIQLYTVRDSITKAPEATFRALREIGYREMEGRLEQIEPHWDLIKSLEMRWINWMIPTPSVTGNYEAWDEFTATMAKQSGRPATPAPRQPLDQLIAKAKKFGVRNLGISILAPAERKDAAALAKSIEALNRAGEQCAKAGLKLYYHNHASEFAGTPGQRPMDVLVKELTPLVWFELDVFWLEFAGQAAGEWIVNLKGRVLSLHLKDMAQNAQGGVNEFAMKPGMFKEVGSGRIDWDRTLTAARNIRVRHYFVEQDYTNGDPVAAVRKSFNFLRGE